MGMPKRHYPPLFGYQDPTPYPPRPISRRMGYVFLAVGLVFIVLGVHAIYTMASRSFDSVPAQYTDGFQG